MVHKLPLVIRSSAFLVGGYINYNYIIMFNYIYVYIYMYLIFLYYYVKLFSCIYSIAFDIQHVA